MKVFISWSGEHSRVITAAFHDWLPNVIQTMQPWMSAQNIDKGAGLSADRAGQLEDTRVGLI
jgi:hypothetical protein